MSKCHDCKRQFKENDEVMEYKVKDDVFLKCKKCHQKDSSLRNFQKTEVWDRVVGYYRPTSAWNEGKKSERNQRKNFKL